MTNEFYFLNSSKWCGQYGFYWTQNVPCFHVHAGIRAVVVSVVEISGAQREISLVPSFLRTQTRFYISVSSGARRRCSCALHNSPGENSRRRQTVAGRRRHTVLWCKGGEIKTAWAHAHSSQSLLDLLIGVFAEAGISNTFSH